MFLEHTKLEMQVHCKPIRLYIYVSLWASNKHYNMKSELQTKTHSILCDYQLDNSTIKYNNIAIR